MLYLNVNDQMMHQWGRTIDLYYSIHLGGLSDEIKSVNLLIEEQPDINSEKTLYQVAISIFPKSGDILRLVIEREHCGEAMEQCFAKAKRYIVRRIRGLSNSTHVHSVRDNIAEVQKLNEIASH